MPVIHLSADQINAIDLSPALAVIEPLLSEVASHEQTVQFAIDYPLEAGDPRELPEVPEVRLWFIRLDALYPWLPFLLDWKAGEFARYTAMLVPHQFHPKDGIQYNPEALEIYVMHKTFGLMIWMQQQGIEGKSRLKAMTQMLGYEIEDDFFDLLTGK
ncbi:MAG: CRR6 family NdhI maturation factor [Leptolyngbyaceae cyanobacterium SU_3_3]|nr:CRR6 family NdhI maturation factor [Leptolyngbyaceae cyanobacterium SU_3_3]NJR51616.1 CRR6 family NdhI maturation factor [Leptolyngbyaceae cyanobacterium CSU_1_3]